MRVISGLRKGRRLFTPKDLKIRPTADRTKQFVFDYLGDVVNGVRVLDLFAGTGNLGIEALSRGASHVTFVEYDRVATKILQKNIEITQFESCSRVVFSDVFRYLKYLANENICYDLIFADPPYASDLYIKILKAIDKNNILHREGTLIIEHKSESHDATPLINLLPEKFKNMGNTTVSFYIHPRGKS